MFVCLCSFYSTFVQTSHADSKIKEILESDKVCVYVDGGWV